MNDTHKNEERKKSKAQEPDQEPRQHTLPLQHAPNMNQSRPQHKKQLSSRKAHRSVTSALTSCPYEIPCRDTLVVR